MEISNAYNKALELEGLLLLLKEDKADLLKTELIFTQIFEKIGEIDEEVDALNRKYMSEAESRPVDIATEEVAVELTEDSGSSESATEQCLEVDTLEENAGEKGEEIADNALFEEAADADIEEVPAKTAPQEVPENITEVVPETITETVPEAGATASPENAPAAPINITIEETGVDVNQSAFAQKVNGDIRKLFTLNDNYKFRRELFGNSQERYAKALAEIEGMSSTYEAENYICNTLNLDKKNAAVKDFLKIISAYFMAK